MQDLRDMVRNYGPVRFSDLVRNTIELQLRAGEDASIESVAQRLSIGVRTLQRRLSSESESFRDCLISVRETRAKALLKESDLTISQIADVLGFHEPDSFRRAFHRWTDVSPSDYRRLISGGT
jgi:AraC-like DNA-binding protein